MNSGKCRLLFLTSHLPYPPLSGGRRREYELIVRLSEHLDITLCVVSKTFKEDCQNDTALRKYCSEIRVFRAINDEAALIEAQCTYPVQVIRNSSLIAARYVKDLVKARSIDIIHIEGFYMMQLVPADNQFPTFLCEQNIEYLLWKQKCDFETDVGRRYRYWQQYLLTKTNEVFTWKRASMCAAVTDDDRRVIKTYLTDREIKLVPNGVDHVPAINESHQQTKCLSACIQKPTILFVGNFAYSPNVDAALYFCREILPRIKAKVATITTLLVGNGPQQEVRALSSNSGIIVTGRVPSLVPYFRIADVFVCPLRIGGGVKMKMLEALHYRKAIVTTSIGAQGIPPWLYRCVYVEDDPEQFAARVINLVQDPSERTRLETCTASVVNTLPSWNDVASHLIACYHEISDKRLWM